LTPAILTVARRHRFHALLQHVRQAQHVLFDRLPEASLMERRRGMIHGKADEIAQLPWSSVYLANALVRDVPRKRESAEGHYHFGSNELKLAVKPRLTRLNLSRQRVAVGRGAALDHIGDVDALTRQVDRSQQFIEKGTGGSNERPPEPVFVVPGGFADEHYLGILSPFAGNHLRPLLSQPTRVTTRHLVAELG
jgi:hypothetical protein